jgi:hypothetical protein
MKALLFSCIFIVCIVSAGHSQHPVETSTNEGLRTLYNDCVDVSVEILTEAGDVASAVNIDCLDKFYYKINIEYKEGCEHVDFFAQCFSSQLEITLGEATIFAGTIQEGYQNEFFESFGDLDIGDMGTPNILDIDINLTIRCLSRLSESTTVTTYSIASLSYPITFLSSYDSSGQVYINSYWDSGAPVNPVPVECDFGSGDYVCCQGQTTTISTKREILYSLSQTSSQDYNVTPEVSISVGAISISIPYSNSVTTNNTDQFSSGYSVEQTMVLEHVPGYCVYPGFIVLEKPYVTERWGLTCEYPYREMISRTSEYIPNSIQFSDHCQIEQPNDCPPIPSEDIDKGFNNGGNILASSCEGYINVNLPNYDGLTIQWSGPNDFVAYDFSIDGLEIGTYVYTIYNDCCESVSGQVQICDNLIQGPWSFDAESQKYCQTLSCEDVLPAFRLFQSNCETVNCVTPDEKIVEYEDGQCVEKHYYQGEYLGERILGPSERNLEYDEDNGNCLKKVYCEEELVEEIVIGLPERTIQYDAGSGNCIEQFFCGDDLVDESAVPATYGAWTFDFVNEQCTRAVFCFGQSLQNTFDTAAPEITETYNAITNTCERTAICNGVPYTLPPTSPVVNGPWSWNSSSGCEKQIQCTPTSDIITVEGEEGFINWSYNSITNQCFSSVTCNGQEVWGVNNSLFPAYVGFWSWNSSLPYGQQCVIGARCEFNGQLIYDYVSPSSVSSWSWNVDAPINQQCVRSAFCGGNQIYEYTTPNFIPTGYICPENSVTQYYVVCNEVNTGITTCLIDEGESSEFILIAPYNSEAENIFIYPNPVKNTLRIDGVAQYLDYGIECRLKLVNLTGQTVLNKSLNNSSVDLSFLNSGLYLVMILIDNELLFHNRIMKQ